MSEITRVFIKARPRTNRRKPFLFMTNRGHLNRLRIHGAMFTPEDAAAEFDRLTADNPDFEFAIVNFQGRLVRRTPKAVQPEPDHA